MAALRRTRMNLPQPGGAGLSVGGVIDALESLSDGDWSQVLHYFNLVEVGPSGAGPIGPAAPVPAGYTRDPATGRVFRQQTAKARAADYERLVAAESAARQALLALSRAHGITVNGGNTIYPNGVDAQTRAEHARLATAHTAAKAAVAAYKAAHPDEFRAPPNRGGRGRLAGGRRTGGAAHQ
jgi:hypothetical protein